MNNVFLESHGMQMLICNEKTGIIAEGTFILYILLIFCLASRRRRRVPDTKINQLIAYHTLLSVQDNTVRLR